MKFTRLVLENWRNFKRVDVPLHNRAFLVGPNASGKSNFLDVFRFLRVVAEKQGGGFQQAVRARGGVSQLRSLFARKNPEVVIEVTMDLGDEEPWMYRLEFTQDNQRRPLIKRERVTHGRKLLVDRPDADDEDDQNRLTQTFLEQVNANKSFRSVVDFLSEVRYLHIVPQLIREPERSVGRSGDPFGGDFLEQLARTPKKTLEARLRKIESALKVAVPQLDKLKLERDVRGVPHLHGLHQHWRPKAGWQQEDQLSDGTLRLLGLLWVLLDGDAPLLLEEPELSLHTAVVRNIPSMMARVSRKGGRQVLVSTHSVDMLSDEGIPSSEVLLLEPSTEGTKVTVAADVASIRALLEKGISLADAVLPLTAPNNAVELSMFPS
ncbi:AAA family ATPase [Chondromyces apiculatus]|nr:AAA family ATPase [Chondromyces apiculatus]